MFQYVTSSKNANVVPLATEYPRTKREMGSRMGETIKAIVKINGGDGEGMKCFEFPHVVAEVGRSH